MNTPLPFKSITELSHLIKNKDIRVIELVREMLQRIEKVDDKLNAFITVNSDAEALAHEADKQIDAGKDIGPLHGIPIGVKDMIDTSDMKTTMGSKIYENNFPKEDAQVVKRLKKAGAIIIGKTNTHQFAYGPTGDRSYYGPMRNPYNTEKMAGGSSGGSAASVAAGLSSGALGTDTSGSIRIPSSFCGLIGMKPTNGLIPSSGVFPLAESLDCVGPMTKTVEDNARMMNVLAGKNTFEEYTRHIGKDISNLTIGIPYPYFLEGVSQEIDTNFQTVKEYLAQAGVDIQAVHIPNVEMIWNAQKTIIAYESYQIHKRNLTTYPDDWDAEVKERLGKSIKTEDEYQQARGIQQESEEIFKSAMKNVDATLTPTCPIATPNINQRVLNHLNRDGLESVVDVRSSITRLTAPTNIVGPPSLTVPSGFSSKDTPLGVQLIGNNNDEAVLYQIGHALEQAFKLNLGVDIG